MTNSSHIITNSPTVAQQRFDCGFAGYLFGGIDGLQICPAKLTVTGLAMRDDSSNGSALMNERSEYKQASRIT